MRSAPHPAPFRKEIASLSMVAWLLFIGATGFAFAQQPTAYWRRAMQPSPAFPARIPPARSRPGDRPGRRDFHRSRRPRRCGSSISKTWAACPRAARHARQTVFSVCQADRSGFRRDDRRRQPAEHLCGGKFRLRAARRHVRARRPATHIKTRPPDATVHAGALGAAAPGGGPGSIWKIDGITGAVSLFANVGYEAAQIPGPRLVASLMIRDRKSLFVADRETGFIHRFNMAGTDMGVTITA